MTSYGLCIPIGALFTGTLPTASVLPALPIFTPSPQASSLALLVAATPRGDPPPVHFTTPPHAGCDPLAGPGPFNPVTSLPTKVVKRILDLEFVEMAEVSADLEPVPVPGRPPPPGKLPVTDISLWVEKFSLLAATLCMRFPEKAPELFAYQASIVRAERNYEAGRWVAYDRQYRREALARKNLNWSVTDPRLYNEAFTGRARSIPRCTYCLQEDHTGQQCPQNPERA